MAGAIAGVGLGVGISCSTTKIYQRRRCSSLQTTPCCCVKMAVSLDEQKKKFTLRKSEEVFNAAKVQLHSCPAIYPRFSLFRGGVWESDFICSLLFVWTGIFRIVLERFLVGLGCVSFESNSHMCWLNEEILSDDRILKFVCQIFTFCFGKFGCLRPKLHVIFFYFS